jgi:uncharacterized repeat protein (TIGR03803 family)
MRSTGHIVMKGCALGAIFVALGCLPSACAQTYQVLYSFAGGTDGASASGSLVSDSAHNLYGTTLSGGDTNCLPPYGCGTVFKLTQAGVEAPLVIFHGTTNGQGPNAGVIHVGSTLYGSTQFGGPANAGTVFDISPSGTQSILYNFQGGADGADAFGGVVRDSAGNLYGTTYVGGNFNNTYCSQNGCGTVYKVDALGNHTILHTFTGPEGALPLEGLVRDSAGNLYGTASGGGTGSCDIGCGVVYKIDAAGNYTVLHNFLVGTTDGVGPASNLTMDQAGNLYGTASAGGAYSYGIIYKLSSAGVFNILHSFNGKAGGSMPETGVIRDNAGNLYGTTNAGGTLGCSYYKNGCGVVFRLTAKGQFTVLHSFTSTPDGANPTWGSLFRDASGNIYGVTPNGGANGYGVVFKITP